MMNAEQAIAYRRVAQAAHDLYGALGEMDPERRGWEPSTAWPALNTLAALVEAEAALAVLDDDADPVNALRDAVKDVRAALQRDPMAVGDSEAKSLDTARCNFLTYVIESFSVKDVFAVKPLPPKITLGNLAKLAGYKNSAHLSVELRKAFEKTNVAGPIFGPGIKPMLTKGQILAAGPHLPERSFLKKMLSEQGL